MSITIEDIRTKNWIIPEILSMQEEFLILTYCRSLGIDIHETVEQYEIKEEFPHLIMSLLNGASVARGTPRILTKPDYHDYLRISHLSMLDILKEEIYKVSVETWSNDKNLTNKSTT